MIKASVGQSLEELVGVGLLERIITPEGEALQPTKILIEHFSSGLIVVSKQDGSSKLEDKTFAGCAMLIALLKRAEETHGQVLWTREHLQTLGSILLMFEPFGPDRVRSFRSNL